MKVLLLTQDINGQGGVGNYFKILQYRFRYHVDYLITGARLGERGPIKGAVRFLADYLNFLLKVSRYDLVHINTSMRIKSFVRDSIFVWLTKLFGKKCLVFIHGWDKSFEKFLSRYLLWLYRLVFFRADAMIVLSREFRDTLLRWGYKKEIHLLTTLVDEQLLDGLTEKDIEQKTEKREPIQVLFLARLERKKGIYEAIDACAMLEERHPHIRLVVAGDGSEYKKAVKYAKDRGMHNIEFLGFVRNDRRRQAFLQSDIYLLPSHGEGMPTSMLEAMGFGLPVITRPVGGIKDFFQPGKMGYLSQTGNAQELSEQLENLITDPARRKEMSLFNFRYVQQNLLASHVREKLEGIYESM